MKTAHEQPTVLVVDDSNDTRDILRRLLQANGCVVAEAIDGQAAVEAARVFCPDLILLDLNLPVMDGLEAAQQIRRLKGECNSVPIVALTAFDTYGIREAALEAGCDEYLRKPVGARELATIVERFLFGTKMS